MDKSKALLILGAFFNVTPNAEQISKQLGVSPQSIRQWPERLTKTILTHVIGRFVTLGRRPPKELIEASKAMK